MNDKVSRRLRSQDWFDNPDRPDMTALYLERFFNYGLTPEELRSGRPIIGIAQSGSDLAPCNRVHLDLAKRVRDGIRDAGGIPLEFPIHPIFENCRRPTAALDRNLAYLGLVELLHGYPFDGVVLTTGCDKTTPAALMAAATVNLPAIVLSSGAMLDGWHENRLVGSGTVIWESRRKQAAGEITQDEFYDRAFGSAPSTGHCNTMGTASTMNAVAEALGMSLPYCAAIPAPYRERGQMAYRTGARAVELVCEDLKPLDIMTREAFLNAVRVVAALGGSTNAQPHLQAIAAHCGVNFGRADWAVGYDIPLLANVQPAGAYLCERFHRAGAVPAVMRTLLDAGHLDGTARTVAGQSVAENLKGAAISDGDVIRSFDSPLMDRAGFLVLSGNFFEFAVMKTSVISPDFRARYLSHPGRENVLEARAVIFESSDDYHHRLNDPDLNIDEDCILVIRGAGPKGWPGSAEVVNMQPPDHLLSKGIEALPTIGDGRQSGTSGAPSILHVSPEAAAGGGLALLRDGDLIRVDLNSGRCDVQLEDSELAARRAKGAGIDIPADETPWQKMYRAAVNDLSEGAVLTEATAFRGVGQKLPRHNH
ncbi:IlvD/Edd family dehydratase [uncultured Marivita sp.]|uniref:IlvD/Edd family dehydratase n=1 Tax=uncultured Marivita sp. TaxID=888080 RepID=UPI0026373D4E|nr:IlvD/Edd family dehydratase [uncultured Marivita sp.]